MAMVNDRFNELEDRLEIIEILVGALRPSNQDNKRDLLIEFAEFLKRTKRFSKHNIPEKVDEFLNS